LFTDYIPDSEVATYFSAADVMVLPYKSATQSGLSAIALNFECPSIATNVGGLAEVVRHEKNGLIVESESPEKLAKSIERYFEENLQPIFSEALKSEKEKYSWANFGNELIKFIESFDSLRK
jgi:glycosyltransferase involved in cell wall biosynthesis